MIKANYEEMQNAANEVTASADEYKRSVEELYKVVDRLQEAWDGVDNQSFVKTANGYKEGLMSLGSVINDYAKFLTMSANVIRETQEGISSAAGKL